ncbi:MAG: glycoside hydrolase family 16 protein [Candidatus Devosia phytovorans]|uniref:Glycoside hydrolase family 16 protein n=1 Tax=Candidatus Devosia phytovorans TaxID=3121372 RepID=A0AAJ6AYA7_9HYPH|nr:glycoside hydrolase family 16 protein [Devosia sp.]WEK03365.1 MAG: glycoside hydrolase family 16 protein [Devosia sp.]
MLRAERELVWADEFDGTAGSVPTPSFWTHEIGGHGWGNGELQTYTDRSDNAFLDGHGNLCVVGRRTGDSFTSARLTSKGLVQFQYGRFETRLKVPAGAGLWSAVWLLGANIDDAPWPACGEIDVVEHVSAKPDRVFGTVHCPEFFQDNGLSGDHVAAEPFTDGFHVFAIDWAEDRIAWSVDGLPYFEVTRTGLESSWVFDHPFYVMVNLAVGGWLGGDVSEDTRFPATLQIDYIRIYSSQPPPTLGEIG